MIDSSLRREPALRSGIASAQLALTTLGGSKLKHLRRCRLSLPPSGSASSGDCASSLKPSTDELPSMPVAPYRPKTSLSRSASSSEEACHATYLYRSFYRYNCPDTCALTTASTTCNCVWTNAGVHSSQVIPITIANWQVKEDPFYRRPTLVRASGTQSHQRRSPGWVRDGSGGRLMGDAALRRQAPTEYLVWNQPRLRRLRSPYIPGSLPFGRCTAAALSDGEHWSPVSYNVQETAQGPTGWYKLNSPVQLRIPWKPRLRIDLVAASAPHRRLTLFN